MSEFTSQAEADAGLMRVLLVEDSQRFRRSIGQALKRSGYAVDATGDGAEGLWFAENCARWRKWRSSGDDDADAASSRETLEIALQMEGIVNRLFDLARCEHDQIAVRPQSVPLAALVQEIWQFFAWRAEQKKLAVRFDIRADRSLQTDPVLLRAILGNLLSNAAEYTPPGGEICVEVPPSGPRCCVRVANTTDQLDVNDLPHLFERFWRKDAARSAPEHCGLGLAVSQAFARRLGCRLDASLDGRSRLAITLSGLAA